MSMNDRIDKGSTTKAKIVPSAKLGGKQLRKVIRKEADGTQPQNNTNNDQSFVSPGKIQRSGQEPQRLSS